MKTDVYIVIQCIFLWLVTSIGLVSRNHLSSDWVMAQFGGQKNPPWATQFAATAVSQPGHSGQSLDLNSLHCEYKSFSAHGFSDYSLYTISRIFLPVSSSWCAAAVSSRSISICLSTAVSISCGLSKQPVCCKLSAVSANCCVATAGCSSCCCSSTTAGQSGRTCVTLFVYLSTYPSTFW